MLPPDISMLDGSRLILNLPVLDVMLELPNTLKIAAASAVNVAPLPPRLVTEPMVILPLVAFLASNEAFILSTLIGALT